MVKEAASEGRLAGAVEQGCRLHQLAAQAADPKLHTQFICVFKKLRVGAPHH